jgi:hypothetical protein
VHNNEADGPLPDDALVVRGGVTSAEGHFIGGADNQAGATPQAPLERISVNSRENTPLIELARVAIAHNQIGVTTVGEIRAAGGSVVRNPTWNPYHCLVSGCSEATLQRLFVVKKNPVPRNERILYGR